MCRASSLPSLYMMCMDHACMHIKHIPCTHPPVHTLMCASTMCIHPPHHSLVLWMPGGGTVGSIPMTESPMGLGPTHHTHTITIKHTRYPYLNLDPHPHASTLCSQPPHAHHAPMCAARGSPGCGTLTLIAMYDVYGCCGHGY